MQVSTNPDDMLSTLWIWHPILRICRR